MSKLAQKIAQRLVEMGRIDPSEYDMESVSIYRLRPGHWQRAGGAWSWTLDLRYKDGSIGDSYGSQWSATECARAKVWDFYTTGIDHGIMPLKEDK